MTTTTLTRRPATPLPDRLESFADELREAIDGVNEPWQGCAEQRLENLVTRVAAVMRKLEMESVIQRQRRESI